MSDCNETKEELEIRRAASLEVLGISAPIPPVTPSQQARPLDEWDEWNGNVLWWKFPIDEPPYVGTPLDTDWPKYHTHWTPLGVPDMPLPARPDEVTKNDRNKDGAIEFIDAVVLNKPIWPNPWGQDVAFAAFKMHTDTNRIAELEALRTEHHQQYTENFAKLEAANDKMRKCLEAIAEHHKDCLMLDHGALNKLMQLYHTERRDFAREGLK